MVNVETNVHETIVSAFPVISESSAEKAKVATEVPKKTSAFSLTKFFKPMNAEEKQRILISELAKV